MAGFMFLLDETTSVESQFGSGVYSTKLSPPRNTNREWNEKKKEKKFHRTVLSGENFWGAHHESTLADFLSMQEGDYVFFFKKRLIYGVGQLTKVGKGCVFNNYPRASYPSCEGPAAATDVLYQHQSLKTAAAHRWLCTFAPSPRLLPVAVDMDDALGSHPTAFRSLRVIENRSFIKLDDEETSALLDVVSRRNQVLSQAEWNQKGASPKLHGRILELATDQHVLSATEVMSASAGDDGSIRHEMALEAGIVNGLNAGVASVQSVLGQWSYVSHQVPASPFKPVKYIDRMDVFGYRRLNVYGNIGSYLVAELKAGEATKDDVVQAMKYVDWVAQSRCNGDYSMIEAFLIAYGFSNEAREAVARHAVRGFTTGARPPRPGDWSNLKLVKYRYDVKVGKLQLSLDDALE